MVEDNLGFDIWIWVENWLDFNIEPFLNFDFRFQNFYIFAFGVV